MSTKFQRKAMGEDTDFGRAMVEVTRVLDAMTEQPENNLAYRIADAMFDVVDGLRQSMNDIESARRKMEGDIERLDERQEGNYMTSADFPITYSWGSHLERAVAKHESGLGEFARLYRIGRAAGVWD